MSMASYHCLLQLDDDLTRCRQRTSWVSGYFLSLFTLIFERIFKYVLVCLGRSVCSVFGVLSDFLRVNSKGFKQFPACIQLSFTCLSHTLASSLLRVRLMGCANWPTLNGISLSLQWFKRKAVWGLNSADGESCPIALCTWLRGDTLDKLLKERWSICSMSRGKVNFQSYSQQTWGSYGVHRKRFVLDGPHDLYWYI